ncbi:MAG: hypothetical protein WBW99_09570, partial [Pseudolabrys sp.]
MRILAATRLAPKIRHKKWSSATKVDIVLGPFAAFELLATFDYLAQAKMPTLAFAGAEDVTQRKADAYLTRTSYT